MSVKHEISIVVRTGEADGLYSFAEARRPAVRINSSGRHPGLRTDPEQMFGPSGLWYDF